jgi:hypothetical protein
LLLIAQTSFAETIEALSVYVKQIAWLNTVPEKEKRPRRDTVGGDLPPITAGGYLIELLFEIGPAQPMAMSSPVAISELEIAAWKANRGISLSAWEAGTIRRLSHEYASALTKASQASCPPFYMSPERMSEDRRAKIGNAMASWADKLNGGKGALQK